MVADFISTCVYLSEKAGQIVREVYDGEKVDVVTKDDESPVTIAALKAQKTIVSGLKSLYPELVIVGEESAESIEHIEVAVPRITDEIRKQVP